MQRKHEVKVLVRGQEDTCVRLPVPEMVVAILHGAAPELRAFKRKAGMVQVVHVPFEGNGQKLPLPDGNRYLEETGPQSCLGQVSSCRRSAQA